MKNAKLRNLKIYNLHLSFYNSQRAGFTFLELMAVIFILSLFAAVVFPSFSVVGGSGMKSEAKRMISVLRYLNDTAISTKETCSLKIDLNSRIVSWKGPDFEKTEAFEHISSMELQSRGKIQEGQVTVFFGPLGIQESLVIHLSDGKEKMSVELNQISGRARIIENAK